MGIETSIEWASKRPDWEQDALRRIALTSELADTDTAAILTNIKQAKGLPQEGELVLEPLTKDHFQTDAQAAPLAHLCSIDKVTNANRLAPGQVLRFALDGITLIYGHNGSGKSGYCRILKKFCRAIVKDTIQPDVFTAAKPAPAEARIRYKLEGATEVSETTWRDGEDGLSDVAHLSVFDSHNARLYVDDRNRIDYLPYEIEMLTHFGQLLANLQQSLLEEIRVTEDRLSIGIPTGYTQGTEVFKLLERLALNTSLDKLPTGEMINELGKWTDELEQELEALQQTIRNDPKVLAYRCRRIQGVVSTLVEELTTAQDTLSQAKTTELEQAVHHARTTAESVSLAATTLFNNEPLPHVGSDSWQLMFQYAKEYSRLVYPNVEPPATGEGDRCALCQQQLAEDAAERLRRFESYVAGEAKKAAQKAAAARDKKNADIKEVQLRLSR